MKISWKQERKERPRPRGLRSLGASVFAAAIADYLLPTACLLLLSGCSGGQETSLGDAVRSMWGPSPKELVAMAFDPNDPDNRREGIIGLSSKDWGLKEPYLKGYAALLKTDKDPLVRAAAVRALGLAEDDTYAPDVTRALLDRDVTVRQDASVALDRVYDANSGKYLRNRALNDADQDVRANACRALRHFPDIVTARVLTDCLVDKEFSVRFHAHGSLVAITGMDLGYEPSDWQSVTSRPSLPPRPAAPKSERPWWDWFGTTRTSGDEAPPAAAQQPAATPATAPASEKPVRARPWWDWFGVTQAKADEPATQPAGAASQTPGKTGN